MKRVRRVEVQLNIDIDEEIKKAMETVSQTVIDKTNEMIATKAAIIASKKTTDWQPKIDSAVSRLMAKFETDDPFISKEDLVADLELTSTQHSPFMLKLNNAFKAGGEFIIEKKSVKKMPHYRLHKIS